MGESQQHIDELQGRIQELESLVQILSQGKYLWESTFDAIQEPVSLIDRELRIQRANVVMAARTGCDIRELIGKPCYQVFADRESPCEGCPVVQALAEHRQSKGELEHKVRDRRYEVFAYPLPTSQSSDAAMVVHYRDTTEEHRLQQEVIQQEKMAAIGMLAGGVAHEINNPLGGILAFSQLMMRDYEAGSPVRNDLEEIERAALRCKKIVQDLLDFSRYSTGNERVSVSLADLFEKVFSFLRREFLSVNIRLHTDIPDDLPPVLGDVNRLQQVFLNLLTNALHAMPKGGDLHIRASAEASPAQVIIEVKDTGEGIAKEHVSRIFDPFFTTKDPGVGTGLGLSISYRIIDEHDGSIHVESVAGEGTCFRITLPQVT